MESSQRFPLQFAILSLWIAPALIPAYFRAHAQDARQAAHEQQAIDKAGQLEDSHQIASAIDLYKKANKLSGDKCVVCLSHLASLYEKEGDNKHAAESAAQLEQLVRRPEDKAVAAMLEGSALLRQATSTRKRTLFQQADAQFKLALQDQPSATQALFLDGLALGRMGEDAAARNAFARYAASNHADPIMQARARRYLANIALVRQTMAPAFSIRTLQGTILNLDNLQGSVVLLDFWATWNDASVQDLPRVQQIVHRFQGQPLVVLSVSLDTDQSKWQTFVAQHGMNWPQFWDKGAVMATTFGVRALPQYFIINAQGVLMPVDMMRGADMAGLLKKMLAQAQR
ncbi:MAG TPA: TlpA disulfide reductase family protein, partial [Acidobacteriaceae bacterium]|nr:TlpA disulfide reductase family protein [Acidobacteriaceae bacterium]